MKIPDNDALLATAVILAANVGYTHVTREALAVAAGVSPACISVRFGTMAAFRRTLMRFAIRKSCLLVVAQGLAVKDPHAEKAPPAIRKAALAALA